MATHTMTSIDHKTQEKVQGLIRMNNDCVRGFSDAADRVDSATLGTLFRELSAERQCQADELREYVAYRGDEEPEKSCSAAGTCRRLWMDMRATLNRGDPYVILLECERVEDHVKGEYQEFIDEARGLMNDPLYETLLRHRDQVVAAHSRIRSLRDVHKARR